MKVGDLYLEPLGKNTRTTLAKLHRIDAQRDGGGGGMGEFLFLMNAFFPLKCYI